MRTADMVKSKYFAARDVKGVAPIALTIADVSEELMGHGTGRNETKCFLWFMENSKGLQLNKSRVAVLEMAFGPDSVLWVGKRVQLSFDPTIMFGGNAVGGIKIRTPPGLVYDPALNPHAVAWGAPPTPSPQGRPPAPVWDENRQMYVSPQPAPARRPPPPVWNEATQQYEVVNTATGEMAPPARPQPPQTISQRVNAGHPPADGDWGPLPPHGNTPQDNEFRDDEEIPF